MNLKDILQAVESYINKDLRLEYILITVLKFSFILIDVTNYDVVSTSHVVNLTS